MVKSIFVSCPCRYVMTSVLQLLQVEMIIFR